MQKLVLFFILVSCFLHSLTAQSLTDSLKLYFPFSGNTLDASGFAHNGTTTGATLTSDRFGAINSAYNFNGVTDYISFTTSNQLRPTTLPVTISAWVNCSIVPNSTTSYMIMTSEYNTTTGNYSGFWFGVVPGGALQINFGNNLGACGAAYRRSCTGTKNICDGNWHLVTGIINSPNNMALYVDCQQDLSTTINGSGSSNPAYSMSNEGRLGDYKCGLSNPNNSHFNGRIDEVRFYHRALSQSEIIALGCNTAINKELQNANFQVFPIPASDKITVQYEMQEAADVKIAIVDILGQVLFTQNYNNSIGKTEHDFAITGLAAGIYYVQLSTKKGVSTKKIIVE